MQRACPFCAELIQPAAVKCRFCQASVPALAAPTPAARVPRRWGLSGRKVLIACLFAAGAWALKNMCVNWLENSGQIERPDAIGHKRVFWDFLLE